MIKFPEKRTLNQINNYFKQNKLLILLNYKKINNKSFPPNLKDLYRIHRFIILNKRLCALEYGTGWSSIVIQHALNLNKKKFKLNKNMRFKKPFSLTIVDDNKKFIRLSKKILFSFFKKNSNTKFHFSKTKMVEYKLKFATEYVNHPVVNPDFIYLDGPSQETVSGSINNFTVKNQDMMPMACDILKYEHFLTPGTIILTDGRTANARFLKSNFQRRWIYKHDSFNDQNIFFLKEKPLGKFNKEQINFYFKR